MMEIEIIPYIGFENLQFSNNRSEIIEHFGEPTNSFKRSANSKGLTDMYVDYGFLLEYDQHEMLALIEVVPPAQPFYRGIQLLSRHTDDVVNELSRLGYSFLQDEVGYSFDEIGVGLYAPYDKVDSVAIYRKGYYEQ